MDGQATEGGETGWKTHTPEEASIMVKSTMAGES